MQTVTRELIDAGENGAGGWNTPQFDLIGVGWPPAAGWKERVIGRPISDADAAKFVALKGKKSQERRELNAGQLKLEF